MPCLSLSLALAFPLPQVTRHSIRCIDASSLLLLDEWQPPAGSIITNAAAASTGVIVATFGCDMWLLHAPLGRWEEVATTEMPHEPACVALLDGGPSHRRTTGKIGIKAPSPMSLSETVCCYVQGL